MKKIILLSLFLVLAFQCIYSQPLDKKRQSKFFLAEKKLRENNYQEAFNLFNEITKKLDHAKSYKYMADISKDNLKNYDQAIQLYNKTINVCQAQINILSKTNQADADDYKVLMDIAKDGIKDCEKLGGSDSGGSGDWGTGQDNQNSNNNVNDNDFQWDNEQAPNSSNNSNNNSNIKNDNPPENSNAGNSSSGWGDNPSNNNSGSNQNIVSDNPPSNNSSGSWGNETPIDNNSSGKGNDPPNNDNNKPPESNTGWGNQPNIEDDNNQSPSDNPPNQVVNNIIDNNGYFSIKNEGISFKLFDMGRSTSYYAYNNQKEAGWGLPTMRELRAILKAIQEAKDAKDVLLNMDWENKSVIQFISKESNVNERNEQKISAFFFKKYDYNFNEVEVDAGEIVSVILIKE